jgi:hypothetical protein
MRLINYLDLAVRLRIIGPVYCSPLCLHGLDRDQLTFNCFDRNMCSCGEACLELGVSFISSNAEYF